MSMDAKLMIKLIIIATVCIIIMHEKIRGYLKAKLLFDISQSTYIKSIIGIALFTIVCVTCNSQGLNKYDNYDSEKERKNLIVNKAFIAAKAEVKRYPLFLSLAASPALDSMIAALTQRFRVSSRNVSLLFS